MKVNKRFGFVAMASFYFVLAGQANAVVIDFESLRTENGLVNDIGSSFTEDGFKISQPDSQAFDLAFFGTAESRFPGSTALFNNTVDGLIRLQTEAMDGTPFDLLSIDLAELNTPSVADVTFVGTLLGGGTVDQTFTLDGVGPGNGLETFSFTGFTDVISVDWRQESPFHQFDNIVINEESDVPAPVPAPGSLALLGLGLAGVGLARRRRRNSAPTPTA